MNHDEAVQNWYDDRKELLLAAYVECQKRTDNNEWLEGESSQKLVNERLEAWAAGNPFPTA